MSVPSVGAHVGAHEWMAAAVRSRGERVFCLVAGIWLFGLFDYLFTVHAHQYGLADEGNPLAVPVLVMGPAPLLGYKLGLLALGTAGLLACRTRAFAEVMTFVVFAAHACVVMRWGILYDTYQMIHEITPLGYRVYAY